MKYFLSAGEASGDLHAAQLITELRKCDPDAAFSFLGGDMISQAAGDVAPVIHYQQMAYMGFSEVIRHLPGVIRNMRTARRALETQRPDALILVDYPSFNLKLAAHAAKLGIPVFYYISPKVWAWKEYRVKTISRLVRHVFCILPFETDFYRRHGVKSAVYVGNPSREEMDSRLATLESRREFIARHNLTNRPILALVPGSRVGEIRNNLPVMASVAGMHPELQPVVAAAPGIDPALYRRYTTYPIVDDATTALMAHAEAALVTSGTATLECALIGTPQVVLYRANGSRIAYHLFKHILHVSHVSLPNLITDREIIPEQLLHHCNDHEVDDRLSAILTDGPARQAQLDGYKQMRQMLGTTSAAAVTARLMTDALRHDNHHSK